MNKSFKTLGKRLKSLRKGRKMTQGELAGKLGIHNSYIGLLERGERMPSLSTLSKMAKYFGVKPVDLLMEEEKQEKLSFKQKELMYIVREGKSIEIEKLYKISKLVMNGRK